MARGRLLSKDASIDPDLNALSLEAELLYILTIPHLDRDGLITGDPVLIWAQAAPKRLALLDQAPKLIQEWIDRGLVERYTWKDGAILFFPGFRKHNARMDYAGEVESRFPPPPGFHRSEAGLIPDDPNLAAQLAANFDARNTYAKALTAAAQPARIHTAPPQATAIATPTGSRRRAPTADSPQKLRRDSADVPHKNRAEDQDQHQTQDQHQSGSDDDACTHAPDLRLDDGEHQPAEPEGNHLPSRAPSAIMDKLALDLIADLREAWQGAPGFVGELDDTQRLCLLTWLWLWDVWDGVNPYDLEATEALRSHYRRNPWDGVQNVVGKIITQTRRGQPAPLHPDDLADLKAVLNERIAELAPNAVLLD